MLEILTGPSQNEMKTVTFNNDLTLLVNNKHLESRVLKLKFIQNIIQDSNFERKYQVKWGTVFNQNFNWKEIWLVNLEIPLSNKEKEFQWKIIHNAIYTEHKLLLMNMSEDGFCHFCKSNLETVAHLFFYCRRINWICFKIEQKLNRVLAEDSKSAIKIAPHQFILGYLHENKNVRVFVNLIIVLVKWEIWKIRNGIKFDNKQVSNNFILEHIMQKIKSVIRFLEGTNIACKYQNEIKLWKMLD